MTHSSRQMWNLVQVIAIVVCALAGTGAQPIEDQPIAIVHGTLLDGPGGPPVQDATVLIRGRVIAAAGSPADVTIPKDARVIDASGKTVMPGLADMHVHFQGGWDGARPLEGVPALWVGRDSGARLRQWTGTRARATLTLEAALVPDTHSDALIATLPGSSPREILIIHWHTDGPNAVEENGGLGILALAKYFARLPVSARTRTLVFVLVPGHFARAYVP